MQTVNPAAERIFGYALVEMTGQNVRMLLPEPLRDQLGGFHGQRRTGDSQLFRRISREFQRQCRKDGSIMVPLEVAR